MQNKNIINLIEETELLLPSILGSKKNVTSWGIGWKERNDNVTNELAVTVYVSKKEDVADEDKIPETINGLPTDVIVKGPASLTTINSSYANCKGCYISSKFVYGTNNVGGGCVNGNCGSEQQDPNAVPNISLDIQSLSNCNCLPNRQVQLATTGANNGKQMIWGGLSATAANSLNSACTTPGTGCSACTGGLIVKDSIDGKLVLLTNHHCFATSASTYLRQIDLIPSAPIKAVNSLIHKSELNAYHLGRSNWQSPSSLDSLLVPGLTASSFPIIGQFKRAVFVKEGGPTEDNRVDAQVVSLNLPDTTSNYTIPLPSVQDLGLGPFPWITKQEFFDLFLATTAGQLYVYKSGRSAGTCTDLQQTYIDAVEVTVPLPGNYTIKKSIQGKTAANSIFFGPGDSGSPVLVNKSGTLHVLGLMYAGAPTGTLTNYSYQGETLVTGTRANILIIPIWEIAEKLQVQAWDGSVVVESSDPTITINGLPYNRTTITNQPITHVKD